MPDTKFIIVEVPEGWECVMCGDCKEYLTTICPLSTAKEAVHVKSADGLEYYAVKKEKA